MNKLKNCFHSYLFSFFLSSFTDDIYVFDNDNDDDYNDVVDDDDGGCNDIDLYAHDIVDNSYDDGGGPLAHSPKMIFAKLYPKSLVFFGSRLPRKCFFFNIACSI